MAKNILQINIKDGDDDLAILCEFLRSGQITSRSLKALSAFYMSLAVAYRSGSSKESIRKAEHRCLCLLKQQMHYIMDKHYREDGIKIDADEFSAVTINQAALSDLGLSTQPLLLGQVLTPTVEASLQSLNIADPVKYSLDAIDALNPVLSQEPVAIEEENDDEEDEEDFENMSEAEYMAIMKLRIHNPAVKG